MDIIDFATRLAVALALGTLIGAEREWRHKLAGLKTNALVCVGSALFTLLSFAYSKGDPTRIAAQVASGIGFLGAGAILRDGLTIRGLTTAATIWCAAAVGAMAGTGWLIHAAVGTGFIVTCNVLLKECARIFFKTGGFESLNDQSAIITFHTERERAIELRKPVTQFMHENHLLIRSISLDPVNGHMAWTMCVSASSSSDHINAESICEGLADRFAVAAGWRLS